MNPPDDDTKPDHLDTDELTTTRRQFLQTSLLTTAAGLTATTAGLTGLAGSSQAHAQSSSRSQRRPNFLILMVDEQRFPPVYESEALREFRHTYLPTQTTLQQNGVEFRRHYAASVACAPSRASIYTGHYPSLHGVTQVDGAAKDPFDPAMFWLDPATVPTMGDYFRQAGYRTIWKGKWHISHADLTVPGSRESLVSYDSNGNRDRTRENLYIKADRLGDYGFEGWVGPEPHGQEPLNSGSSPAVGKQGRDLAYADQVIEMIQQLGATAGSTPWLLVASMINPHDIALWGFFANLQRAAQGAWNFEVGPDVPFDLFDTALFQQTRNDNLLTKPSCHKSYRDSYQQWQQPIFTGLPYYRFYYQLHQNVDQQLGRIYQALQRSPFFNNTYVIFTSDHGDLLGAHGDMHQKWYTAYEEALRVPFVVTHPTLIPPRTVEIPTSHVDLLPTMLGLAGLNTENLRRQLSASHSEARPFVGRDLSGVVLGRTNAQAVETPIYFMTDDDASRGLDQENFVGIAYDSVIQPNHIEAVITRLNGQLWKYARYFDNPQFWSDPGTPGDSGVQDVVVKELGSGNDDPGTQVVPFQKTVKVCPAPDEYELYNLDTDPMELTNLAGQPAYASIENQLHELLQQQCAQKRLTPSVGTVAGQPACEETTAVCSLA